MTLISTFWSGIVYSKGERLIFEFLDTTADGRKRCRLCDGQETTEIFRGTYTEIIEHGEQKPC